MESLTSICIGFLENGYNALENQTGGLDQLKEALRDQLDKYFARATFNEGIDGQMSWLRLYVNDNANDPEQRGTEQHQGLYWKLYARRHEKHPEPWTFLLEQLSQRTSMTLKEKKSVFACISIGTLSLIGEYCQLPPPEKGKVLVYAQQSFFCSDPPARYRELLRHMDDHRLDAGVLCSQWWPIGMVNAYYIKAIKEARDRALRSPAQAQDACRALYNYAFARRKYFVEVLGADAAVQAADGAVKHAVAEELGGMVVSAANVTLTPAFGTITMETLMDLFVAACRAQQFSKPKCVAERQRMPPDKFTAGELPITHGNVCTALTADAAVNYYKLLVNPTSCSSHYCDDVALQAHIERSGLRYFVAEPVSAVAEKRPYQFSNYFTYDVSSRFGSPAFPGMRHLEQKRYAAFVDACFPNRC